MQPKAGEMEGNGLTPLENAIARHKLRCIARNIERLDAYKDATGIERPEQYLYENFKGDGEALAELKRVLIESHPELFEPIIAEDIVQKHYGQEGQIIHY